MGHARWSLLVLLALPLPTTGAPSSAPGLTAAAIDDAWLEATHDALEARYGPAFLDVGYAAHPRLHVAALFAGPPPADLGSLHPDLATVGYDLSSGVPMMHGPIVPVMRLLAQQVPDTISPGSWVQIGDSNCSLAHVLSDTTGLLYVLTAGHCTAANGQRARLLTRNGATGITEIDFGFVRARRFSGIGDDFALIRIDPEHVPRVDPSMIGWAGPQGVATSPETGAVHHYGFGSATWYAHATRCRQGQIDAGFWGFESYAFTGVLLWGDSGSGSDFGSGRALGINTHLNVDIGPANSGGTRITYAIPELEQMTGLDLALVDGVTQRESCKIV